MTSYSFKKFLVRFSRPLILVLSFIVFSVTTPNFWSINKWNNVMNIVLTQSPFLILMAVSMTLSIILKGIDLSIGSSVAMICCLVGFVLRDTYNSVLGIVVGLAAGTLIGLINGFLISKVKVSTFIATYSMQWILRGGAMLLLGGKQIYDLGPTFSNIFVGSPYTLILITAIVVILMSFLLRKTVFGQQIYATGINQEAARISGIRVDKVILITYTISGFLIGLTSVMYTAYLKSAEPVIGGDFALRAIAASLIGGAAMGGGNGKISNAVIGAYIMLTLSNGMVHLGVRSEWQDVIVGIVIVMSILLERLLQKIAVTSSDD
jgi:ribose transport system permease protein